MLEQIYNFGRSKLVGLKTLATMALRERSAVVASLNNKAKKQKKEAAQSDRYKPTD